MEVKGREKTHQQQMKCSALFVCSGLFLVKRKTLKKALGLGERDDYPEQEWPEGALLVLLGYFFFFFLRRSTFLAFVFNMQRFNNSYYKMFLEIAHFLDDYRV